MEAYNIEIGELIATTNGFLGYVIECVPESGVFHVEWAVDNSKRDWYYDNMILLFRENLYHHYGQFGR